MQEHIKLAHQMRRVIAIDPAMKVHRTLLFFGGIIFVIYILALFFHDPLYSVFFGSNSCFSFLWLLAFYPFFSFIYTKKWRNLENKRQEAAYYNLTSGTLMPKTFDIDKLDISLPFVIRLRRRELASIMWSILGGLLIAIIIFLVFKSGQNIMQLVTQHQETPGWAFVQILLNLATSVVFILPIIRSLFLAPRQQLAITQEGLICQRGYHFSSIPWQSASLFAVIASYDGKKDKKVVFYELSSKDTIIRWSSTLITGGSYSIIGGASTLARPEFSLQDYERRIQMLVSIIGDRTGLPLSDLR